MIYSLIVYLFIWYVHVQLCQTQSPRTKFPPHTQTGMPQPLTCLSRPLELLAAHNSCNNIGASIPVTTDINLSPSASTPLERGVGTNNLVCSNTIALIFILLNLVCCYLIFCFVYFTFIILGLCVTPFNLLGITLLQIKLTQGKTIILINSTITTQINKIWLLLTTD